MKKKLYKSYHLIIIPYDKTGGRSILFTVKALKLLTLLLIMVIAIPSTLITLHTRNYYRLRTTLFPTLEKNSILTRENSEMKEETAKLELVIDSLTTQLFSERAVQRERLKSLNERVERIKKFAENLRIMAGFKLEPNVAQPPGLGGPVPEQDDENFLFTEDVEKQEILLAFNEAGALLSKKLTSSKEKLKFLWDYFENKSSVIEGTPEIQPVPGFIISGFGYRINPFSGREEFHRGIDIPAPTGTKIKAPADGVVIFVGRRGGYGYLVEIDHGNNYKTVYGHLHTFDVEVGDRVRKGDFIGEVGSTGRSTGAHLHYEVRLNNVAVDPVNYLKSVEERKKEFEEKKDI
ncbi:MAG: hypothetical protein E3J87_01835 [Candidatus Cloacimonadota bacterium]|nr:MAG: hypothetical protein E3J87_01835 [Candidatus Cloacimonadota bacterium]